MQIIVDTKGGMSPSIVILGRQRESNTVVLEFSLPLIVDGNINLNNYRIRLESGAYNVDAVTKIVLPESLSVSYNIDRALTAVQGTINIQLIAYDNNADVWKSGVLTGMVLSAVSNAEMTEAAATLSTADEGIINVKSSGAQGDGKTDDTSAIQAAIDFCLNNKQYSKIYFPQGIYKTTATIKISSGLWIDGAGKHGGLSETEFDGTEIRYYGNDGKPIFDISPVTEATSVFKFMATNMRLNNASKVKSKGLYSSSISEFTIRDVNFNGGFDNCIQFDEVTIGTIDNCDFVGSVNGIAIGSGISVWIYRINAWQLSGASLVVTQQGASISYRDSWVEYCQYGVLLQKASVDNLIFDNVHYTNATASGQTQTRFMLITNDPAKYTSISDITLLNCYVDIKIGSYAIEIKHDSTGKSATYTGIKLIGTKLQMSKATAVSAIYANTSAARFFIIGETVSADYDGTIIPLVGGNARYYYLQDGYASLSILGTGSVVLPSNISLQSYTEGQLYWDSTRHMLKATDGTTTKIIPYQAESQANSTASNIAALKTDFNALLAKLRAANILKT